MINLLCFRMVGEWSANGRRNGGIEEVSLVKVSLVKYRTIQALHCVGVCEGRE